MASDRHQRVLEGAVGLVKRGGTDEERANAKARAEAYAERHNLHELLENLLNNWDVEKGFNAFKRSGRVKVGEGSITFEAVDNDWASQLMAFLSKSYRCQIIRRPTLASEVDSDSDPADFISYHILGVPSDINSCIDMAEKAADIGIEIWESGTLELDEFATLMGEIARQLAKSAEERRKRQEALTSGSELVLYQSNLDEEIEKKVHQTWGITKEVHIAPKAVSEQVRAEASIASKRVEGMMV